VDTLFGEKWQMMEHWGYTAMENVTNRMETKWGYNGVY
jgi:hypothetical protein